MITPEWGNSINMMDAIQIKKILLRGEDSRNQFKQDIISPAGLAAEMAAFSNTLGGTILIGIADDHTVTGLTRERISAINQLISNMSSQGIHPPVNPITEIIEIDGKNVISLTLDP